MSLGAPDRELLKAMFRLGPAPVRPGDLATALDVAPATVTARVKRLTDAGAVTHTRYRGVELTAGGRRAAVAAIRRHRIVERFLADMLGYPWNEADRHATAFEHGLPQEVEDRLFVALDRPSSCPHGFPIPEHDADDVRVLPALAALEPGDEAVVAVPGATDAAVVAFLDTLGVRPGVHVRVTEKHPFEGPLVLEVDGHTRTVGYKLASEVFVNHEEGLMIATTRKTRKKVR